MNTKLSTAQRTALQAIVDGKSFYEHYQKYCLWSKGEKLTKISRPTFEALLDSGFIRETTYNDNRQYYTYTTLGMAALMGIPAAERSQRDATNEAKRIVVSEDGDIIEMVGKREKIRGVIFPLYTEHKAHITPELSLHTNLRLEDIDDMIALLTAAKAELARRSETAVQS